MGLSLVAKIVLIALVAGAGLMMAGGSAQAAGAETYMVAMRDKVRLATDIYLPRGRGPWPVILMRTPYNKEGGHGRGLRWHGYVVVVQDMRGRFASEGRDMAFMDCARDGADTVAWILKQPWCNGKVGTLGGSALGITQNMLAPEHPPGLVAQHIAVAAADFYGDAAYQGGVLRQSMVLGWLENNEFDPENAALIRAHPKYDALWAGMNAVARAPEIRAAGMHLGGWFDCFSQGTINAFVSRQTRGGKGARGNQWLVMGPWVHGPATTRAGEFTFPESAGKMPEHTAPKFWFDYWLKGKDNGLDDIPHVAYYTMGACGERGAPGNEWRTADAWPVRARDTAWYLRPDGSLSRRKPMRNASPLAYTYDPQDPVPTLGGCNLNLPSGPMDQRPVEGRPDVLVFTSPPLEKPVEVTGRVRVRLYASSSAPDTDFTAKLCDVYPDGRSMLVCDGIIRARHRRSLETEHFLTPGKAYAFDIDLWSTSLIFNRGHRIRVAISSSNAPRFEPNPNTKRRGKPREATQAVYCDGRYPSAVVLPVVKG